MKHSPLLALVPLALLTLACAPAREAVAAHPAPTGRGARARSTEPIAEPLYGAPLFAEQCALCHGLRGRGDGPAAALLMPPPRDFGHGRFQLVSTKNGVPSDADLVRLLERGMPGSSMPPYEWLSEAQLLSLARHVRELAVEGLRADLLARAKEAGETLTAEEAGSLATERMTPGEPLELGEPARADEATLARGRTSYLRHCAVCHGMEGSGRGREPRWNAKGELEWARDFRAGVLKGEATHAALSARIGAGMPGSTMPATVFADLDERAALVAYVQSLLPAGAGEILVRHRREIVAECVAELPADEDEAGWRAAAPVRIELAPNAWRDDAVLALELRALHDGRELALHVSWEDATRNDRVFGEFELSDGLAALFSEGEEVPPYGMGSPARPLELWHWKAFRLSDVAGVLDLLARPPHASLDPLAPPSVADVPTYLPAPAWAGPRAEAGESLAEGLESASRFASDTLGIRAAPRWADGRWTVVLARTLEPAPASAPRGALRFAPGRAYQLALAVWNGAARDEGAQKSLSTWNRLRLAEAPPAR